MFTIQEKKKKNQNMATGWLYSKATERRRVITDKHIICSTETHRPSVNDAESLFSPPFASRNISIFNLTQQIILTLKERCGGSSQRPLKIDFMLGSDFLPSPFYTAGIAA